MSSHARFALAAGACALLAAWLTFGYAGRAERRDGPRVAVLVAPAGLKAGAVIDETGAAALEIRAVPKRFAPPDAIADAVDVIGARSLAPVAAGGFVTRSLLAGGTDAQPGFKLRSGERALTVEVIVSPSGETLAAGDRVDLYASGFGGDQRTTELIAGAEVLAAEEASQPSRMRATLRLADAQVASVIRADVFARELRAVVARADR